MKQKTAPSFDIVSIVRTQKDASELLSKLDELINAFYNIKTNASEKINELLPYDKKEHILAIMQGKHVKIDDTTSVQNYLIGFRNTIQSLPVITMHLAFEPTQDTVASFSNWFLVTLKKEVLLDLVLDQSLIGGCAIEYKGKYKEYSVKKKLEELYNLKELHL